MNDIFGRVAAIMLAAAVLCGMPLVYMKERQKSASQLYLLAESTRFIDSVCNTGFISQEMLWQFYQEMVPIEGICEIRLLHETKELVYEEEKDICQQISTFYDEQDIQKCLEQGKRYYFSRNDFLRITICVDGGMVIFPWHKDMTQNVSYGGVIKYEAY